MTADDAAREAAGRLWSEGAKRCASWPVEQEAFVFGARWQRQQPDPHVLSEPEQMQHVGGKNGFWLVRCSCGYTTGPHGLVSHARSAADDHARAKAVQPDPLRAGVEALLKQWDTALPWSVEQSLRALLAETEAHRGE